MTKQFKLAENKLTQSEKLATVKALLADILENWDNNDVKEYGAAIDFEEIVLAVSSLHFKN